MLLDLEGSPPSLLLVLDRAVDAAGNLIEGLDRRRGDESPALAVIRGDIRRTARHFSTVLAAPETLIVAHVDVLVIDTVAAAIAARQLFIEAAR